MKSVKNLRPNPDYRTKDDNDDDDDDNDDDDNNNNNKLHITFKIGYHQYFHD